MSVSLAVVLRSLLLILSLVTHGDLSLRIAEKSSQIEKEPNNGLLYLQRAELYLQHEQPDSALMDLNSAINHGVDSSVTYLMMAEAQLTVGKLDGAISSIAEFIRREPESLKGIHTRGSIMEASGKHEMAISDFQHVLNNTARPRPQDVLHLAEIRLKTTGAEDAIETLKQGIEKLGNIVSLQMKIYELEKDRGNYAAAHQLLDQMMKPLSRKERLLVEKAELYLLQGQPSLASRTLTEAENIMAQLPPRFRNLEVMVQLDKKINELKKKL